MTTNHSQNSTPPPFAIPQVVTKQKETYRLWLAVHRDFPKTERFGIGQKIEQSFLDVLEFTFASAYLPLEQKIIVLSKAIARLDALKFFLQLAWESKLIPNEKYAALSEQLEMIGKMLGGWKKGLQTKTPKP